MPTYYYIDSDCDEVICLGASETDKEAMDRTEDYNSHATVAVARLIDFRQFESEPTPPPPLDPIRVDCPVCNNGILQISYHLMFSSDALTRVKCDCATGPMSKTVTQAIQAWQAAKDAGLS